MPKIEMQPVKSGNVSKVGYDPDTKTLAIEFSNGMLYYYDDVKKDVYDDLLACKSFGKHVHANIKGKYKYSKQETSKPD